MYYNKIHYHTIWSILNKIHQDTLSMRWHLLETVIIQSEAKAIRAATAVHEIEAMSPGGCVFIACLARETQ